MTTKTKTPNHLVTEKSPYLLQHAYNPVDWFPWSDSAFDKAKAEDKPIFLSIGYSTCHWCHVMERESFEDEKVAEVLNEGYVAIKVDREERPDIDHLYMTFCQAMTGQGGWPLTIIMTPEKKPFFAGTYFPKRGRMGIPGLIEILERVKESWSYDNSLLVGSGNEVTEAILAESLTPQQGKLKPELLDEAFRTYRAAFDSSYGGFGRAPKFPSPHNLAFLLRYGKAEGDKEPTVAKEALRMVEKTLDSMYQGGLFDHIGFGFSRYSTDKKWLVPHFEKMLYDNALLSLVYVEAYQVTKKPLYREVAEKTFTYILRDMTSPEGAFYSAEDADSEGEEGKFYLLTPEEIIDILGEEKGQLFCRVYDISSQGNFEGKSIPNLLDKNLEDSLIKDNLSLLEECRRQVFLAREKRIHPYKDDKILTSWNALMITAFAVGARVFDNKDYLAAAEKAVEFIFKHLQKPDGRLLARYRDNEAAYPGYLDDYSFLTWALIELYQTTYRPGYLKKALKLNSLMLKLFWDGENDGLFMVGEDGEALLARPKEIYDGATPAGNSVAAMNLLRLAALTGTHELHEKAEEIFLSCGGEVRESPSGYAFLLQAFLGSQKPFREIVIVSGTKTEKSKEMISVLQKKFLPDTVSHYLSSQRDELLEVVPFLRNYNSIEGKPTVYICENGTCSAPFVGSERFKEKLR